MTPTTDYGKVMSDRKLFNQMVYTPMSQATKLLDERRKDSKLITKVEELLKGDIPGFFKEKGKCAIFGRHIATPNHESRMFITLAKENNLHPVFFEYLNDKFTSNNTYKHSLGQLQIQKKGTTKDGSPRFEKINIIDFNTSNGKKIKEIKTLWGDNLVDFHRKLFPLEGYSLSDLYIYDASPWFKVHGGKALDYYVNLLLLFTCYGILFENFLTSDDEDGEFTKNIVLPAIEKVLNLTGVKPLITPIGPLEVENEDFWIHHLPKIKEIIPKEYV